MGDSANNAGMLRAAELRRLPVCPAVAAVAADAQVNHTDLAALLYFQGYTRDSFVD